MLRGFRIFPSQAGVFRISNFVLPRGQNKHVGNDSVEILRDLWLDPSFKVANLMEFAMFLNSVKCVNVKLSFSTIATPSLILSISQCIVVYPG